VGDSIQFIGGGNMGAAIVVGLVRAGWDPGTITVVETSADRRSALHALVPGVTVIDAPRACSAGVVAVKPGGALEACRALAGHGAARVLSIAAGIGVEALQAAAGGSCAVVRAMPNTPALVGEAVSAITGSTRCALDDLDWAESVLGAVGTVVRVPEHLMDAVTAVSGSGPAYVFLLAEALVAAGIEQGLDPHDADELVRQLLVGAARLLRDSSDGPDVLRARVTSPNGVTERAIEAFEAAGFREAVRDAVTAAVRRSEELGN
jgi:pyrroline-5-carboxylate reductase